MSSRQATPRRAATSPAPDLDALIVGAGFAGLYMLYRMRDVLGLKACVYERGDGVGGTWFWNRYPGARCDSESFYYSYSFSEELEQAWDWTSKYPEQPEILSYLNHVADRFELRRDIQLDTCVTEANFDEAANCWDVRTEAGERITARFLIAAVGCLSAANVPGIPGLDQFEGDWYHTGAWPHQEVDFSGKRVGLIGTGSTGIQATPVIAAQADHLTVFQRTANFSVPTRNARYTPEAWAEIKANYREIRRVVRASNGGFPYVMQDRSAFDVSDEERNEIYEGLWKDGGFKFLWGSFNDLLTNSDANTTAADFIRGKIRETVKDPGVAAMLTPNDHPFATKRPPIDTHYFATFNRDNVTLVDIRNAPITEITPHGLRTENAEYELDTIVFATGFDAMTGSLLKMGIRGVGGRTLAGKWADGPKTYLGLQIAGFPNLFTITGPGSPSVLSNMPVSIELHAEWISDCIDHMREHGFRRIEAEVEAEDRWVDHVSNVADLTLHKQANSWYLGANIPGKKRVFMPYVGGLELYNNLCNYVVNNGYSGFELSS
ncbi:MAG: NAD(P)/FAD-dependent oxidoreductase [Myxococcota bacterium]